jgi:RimJ/RimL family protein N-acetyltransferase
VCGAEVEGKAMLDVPFLSGEKIYLRALRESDAQGPYPSWFNDEEVCRGNSHHVFPYTLEQALAYIREGRGTNRLLVLAIIRREEGTHIGNIALDNIDYINRSAGLTILVGDKTTWGRGYGKEAARLICEHGFLTLNLHRIAAGTFHNNIGFQKIAAYLGMVEEGRRRQAAYKNGRYLDIIEYGLLKDEFVRRFNLESSGDPSRDRGEAS